MRYIEEACIKLISSQPFYANLLTQMEAIEDSRIPVAGYSIQKGKIFLHINSFVFNQLSLENRKKILIHELLHVIAKHPSRQKNTYKKQNKKLISEGLPGFKKTKKLNLVVAVDTSSSVAKNNLKIFATEIIKIQKCGANVTIIECDCQIKKAYKLKKKFHPQFEGRGGTDFRPVWNYIEKHRLRPVALIYLTDGQGQAPIKSKYPTLWVLTPSGELPWILTSNDKEQVS